MRPETEDLDVPWLLDCKPRPVQIEALRRSYLGYATQNTVHDILEVQPLPHAGGPARGWAHFMEMRLGKTPTALNEFELLRRDGLVDRMVILSPNMYKVTWAKEMDTFGVLVPHLVFDSRERKTAEQWVKRRTEGAIVVNYEAIRSESTQDLLYEFLNDRTMLVADESVMVKNFQARTTKHVLTFARQCAYVRALTGQPAPQGVHDLFAQMRLVRKFTDVNFYQFRNRYAIMGGWQGKKVVGLQNQRELAIKLRETSFVAKRKNWVETTEPDYETVELSLRGEQLEHYRTMDNELMVHLNDEENAVTADQAGAKWAKLQQISSGFVYDENGQPKWLVEPHQVPKFRDLIQRIEFVRGKILIMAQHSATVEMLVDELKNYNPAVIASGTLMRKLGRTVDAEKEHFNLSSPCKLMVCQVRAVKYGHTLLGTDELPCNTTIYYENSFSLDDRIQSEQRNQSATKSEPIHVVDYVSGEAERRVIASLQRKSTMAEAILKQEGEQDCA